MFGSSKSKKGSVQKEAAIEPVEQPVVSGGEDLSINRLFNTVLTYSIEPNNAALTVILDKIPENKMPILFDIKAVVRYRNLENLQWLIQENSSKAPTDYVSPADSGGVVTDESDVEVNVL